MTPTEESIKSVSLENIQSKQTPIFNLETGFENGPNTVDTIQLVNGEILTNCVEGLPHRTPTEESINQS